MDKVWETGKDFWVIFRHYFLVNSTEEPTYLLTRQHFGSYAAFALAVYNTYLLRQKIIKNAIALTRSNSANVVRVASFGVGLCYFVGLSVVWHIPSLFAELAVRVYCSTQNATTTLLFARPSEKRYLMNRGSSISQEILLDLIFDIIYTFSNTWIQGVLLQANSSVSLIKLNNGLKAQQERPYSDIIILMQQQHEGYMMWVIFLIGFIALFSLIHLKRSSRKQRIRRKLSEAKKNDPISKQVIIVAVEIVNFIVKYSEKYNKQFKLLNDCDKNIGMKIWNYLTNIRPCFCERFARKAIRKFFKELKAIENIKLVLYTKLEREICNKILEDLNILTCFQEKDRLYTADQLIFAQEIDDDTGRVIIISANKEDLDRSITSHHTIILQLDKSDVLFQESILTNLKQCLIELAAKGRIDSLHEDMHELTHKKGLPIYNDENDEN